MNKFTRLTELRIPYVVRGGVFRLPAKYPYESVVDFMICENYDSSSGFSLIVTTGYKSGITFLNLPRECLYDDCSISVEWLIKNWCKWVYDESSESDVYFSKGYTPRIMQTSRIPKK
ncbi:Imm45 family immunity protein [Asaia sp. VD9]|uniref:Imm45 family immunity protein n=1 Tax=Asaia sp. VD9 TaxID=3081235 RepID=UPI0038D1F030